MNVCKEEGNYYDDDNCKKNNWLYSNNYQWTISPGSSYPYGVFNLEPSGYVNGYIAYIAMTVRPVQYLKANVIITGGNGTEKKPYTIAANPTNAAEYVENLYSDGSTINTVNIAGDASKPEVHLNANQGIMLDNNGDYRYYGANPNNYVKYNDELWRIISVGNVKANENDTVGETRVKIVKADILTAKETGTDTDITAFSYDSSDSTINSGYGVNDWSKSDLMTELNTLYYNSTSGTCYTSHNNTSKSCDFTNTGLSQTARNLTADALYYLGGSSSYEGLYADDYYDFERGTTVWGASADQTCNDGSCPRATTWTGRVGIIYPSDFIYATDLSVCKSDGYDYNTDICENNDWLLYTSNWQWTISPRSSTAYSAFYVYSSGSVYGNYGTLNPGAVRPVQYLKSNVAIVGGEGTSEKPYLLELW